MPGYWAINPSGAWQAGSAPVCCLMDRFLLAPAQRGLLQARLGSSAGDKCGTAACASSCQAWHCHLATLLGWRARKMQAAGCCWVVVGGLLPVFCSRLCSDLCPNSHLSGWPGARAGFAPPSRRWVPRGGHRTAHRVYLQTGGSWHRAAGHQRDPMACNVNYHHVIKSP